MHKAYLKADSLEDPLIIKDLKDRLAKQAISLQITTLNWQEIDECLPFLYYRNPYIRFPSEKHILDLHHKSPEIRVVKSHSDEILSVNPSITERIQAKLDVPITFQKPLYSPLPILIGTHNRPEYFQLTLNSLRYTTKDVADQKFYIVASAPDQRTDEIIRNFLKEEPRAEAVFCYANLSLTLFNFASRFFKLTKFIHFEDDGLLPESTHYQMPFWTQQLTYRATTADLVGFRVSEDNRKTWLHQQKLLNTKIETFLNFQDDQIWHYFEPKNTDQPPISGNGLVIDFEKHYKNSPFYQTDLGMYFNSQKVCIINIPIYHIGANSAMDYPKNLPAPKNVAQFYYGTDGRTGETRKIDLLE